MTVPVEKKPKGMTAAERKAESIEKKALKRQVVADKMEAIFKVGKGSDEPVLNTLSYKPDLIKALNYYNAAFDAKDKRKWVMTYVGKANVHLYENLSDHNFNSIGAIIRLKGRGQPLEDKELMFIETTLDRLRREAAGEGFQSLVKPKAEVVDLPTVIIDKVAEAVSEHSGVLEGMVDEFLTENKEFDPAEYFKVNTVSPNVLKAIPQKFKRILGELQEAVEGSDAQLVEAYSYMKKPKLKKLLKIYQSIVDACVQQVITIKAAKPVTIRKKKEKPASVLVAKVKYMKEFPELNLKSILPVLIVGSTEVWVYNVKYKKLMVYRGENGGKLSVKGTSITGYEVATSSAKGLRKPEVTIPLVLMNNKKQLVTDFKALTTKEAAVNGRLSEDTIILRAF